MARYGRFLHRFFDRWVERLSGGFFDTLDRFFDERRKAPADSPGRMFYVIVELPVRFFVWCFPRLRPPTPDEKPLHQ